MWKFTLKQDNLVVAKGFGPNKEFVINEACRYFSQYEDEDYEKMTLVIERQKRKRKVTSENFMDNLTNEEMENYAKIYD